MTTYEISTWNELVANSPYQNGDLINLTADFTTTNTNIINLTSATLDGQNHTITFSGRTKGLFQVAGATIQNLIIDGNNVLMSDYEGLLVSYNYVQTNYCTVNDCQVHNARLGRYGGGFIGGISIRNSGQTVSFNRCYVYDLTFSSRFSSGFVGRYATNVVITNSRANVSMSGITESAAFIGHEAAGNNSLTGSYAVIDSITSGACGGLVGQVASGTTEVRECYVIFTGTLSGTYCGGLLAGINYNPTPGTVINVYDCYVVGEVTGYAGALVGYHSYGGVNGTPNSINLYRCYHVGNLTGKFLIGAYSDDYNDLIVTDCVLQPGNVHQGSGVVTYIRTDTSIEGINLDLPDGDDDGQSNFSGFANNWSSDVWQVSTDVSKPYPMLKTFQDSVNWDNSYTSYDSAGGVKFGGGPSSPNNNNSLSDIDPIIKIMTPNGYKPVNNLTVGDQVSLSNRNSTATIKNLNYNDNKQLPNQVVHVDLNGNRTMINLDRQFTVKGKTMTAAELLNAYYYLNT